MGKRHPIKIYLWQFEEKSFMILFKIFFILTFSCTLLTFLAFRDVSRLNDFLKWSDTIPETINFHYHESSITFLDITVYKDASNQLAVKVFTKHTDQNSLLHFDSFHPLRLCQKLPAGQFMRFMRLTRNSTTYQDYNSSAEKIAHWSITAQEGIQKLHKPGGRLTA